MGRLLLMKIALDAKPASMGRERPCMTKTAFV
jgi:hypothetical protein